MSVLTKPHAATEAFAAAIDREIVLAQVVIRRLKAGFELRHQRDEQRAESELRLCPPEELRALAQRRADGAFRPLKAAPHLQSGWRCLAAGVAELEVALNGLYPGAVADWHAVRRGKGTAASPAAITSYRQFTERQTGMYRITTKLDDRTALRMVRACCHRDFCLKQRLWTVNGTSPKPDPPDEKSLIPCLEPCAILLEFARKIVRLGQEEKAGKPSALLPPSNQQAPSQAGESLEPVVESDFDDPRNPRRQRFVLEKRAKMIIETKVQ